MARGDVPLAMTDGSLVNGRRIIAAVTWLHGRRRAVNAWIVRGVSFYFGYKILHHEVYATNPDGLLVMLGLWLCGVAPTSFFDQLRKAGMSPDLPGGGPEAEAEGKNELESQPGNRHDEVTDAPPAP